MKTLKVKIELSKVPWPENMPKQLVAAYAQNTLESAGYLVTLVKCEEETNEDQKTDARGNS